MTRGWKTAPCFIFSALSRGQRSRDLRRRRSELCPSCRGKRKKKIDPVNSAVIDGRDKVERGWLAVRKQVRIYDFRKFDEIDNGER
jgi:hypothetical protein